jgi:hypothetical protein
MFSARRRKRRARRPRSPALPRRSPPPVDLARSICMKTKLASLLSVLLLASLVTGCKTTGSGSPGLSRGIARATASSAVLLAAAKDPRLVPYMQIATPIICQASSGTNHFSPQQIVDALNLAGVDKMKTPVIVVLMNSLLSFYSAAFQENQGTSSPVLEGICLGLQDGLVFLAPPAAPSPAAIRQPPKLPPHLD